MKAQIYSETETVPTPKPEDAQDRLVADDPPRKVRIEKELVAPPDGWRIREIVKR